MSRWSTVGVVDRRGQHSVARGDSDVARVVDLKQNQAVFTTHSDVSISRSGDFRADNKADDANRSSVCVVSCMEPRDRRSTKHLTIFA